MEDKIKAVKRQINISPQLVAGFAVVFLMTYGVVLVLQTVDGNDYYPHVCWALEIKLNNLWEFFRNTISYPLWHFGVKLLTDLRISAKQSAALITALFNASTYLAVIWGWKRINKGIIRKEKTWFWAICLLVANPLYAPWINRHYYLGQAAPNIWHNPTNLAVKLFSVIGFVLIIVLLNFEEKERSLKTYVALSVVLLLSVLAKPAFLQAIIPGLAVFILIRLLLEKKAFPLAFYCKLCLTFVPAVCVFLFQSFATFFNKDFIRPESYICIGWGRVLHHWTPNLLVSFILAFAFPVFVFLWDFKRLIKKKEIQLTICYEAVAWLESVLIYEEGEALFAANFTWANLISAFVVWMMMLGHYMQVLSDNDKESKTKMKWLIVGNVLLVLHLVCGIVYWGYLCTGNALC